MPFALQSHNKKKNLRVIGGLLYKGGRINTYRLLSLIVLLLIDQYIFILFIVK